MNPLYLLPPDEVACHPQVIRHYHGHLSGIYALQLHPTLDLLMTGDLPSLVGALPPPAVILSATNRARAKGVRLPAGGRDSTCRVWDMRTKLQVHCLSGHDSTVCSILTQGTDPQASRRPHIAAPPTPFSPLLFRLCPSSRVDVGGCHLCPTCTLPGPRQRICPSRDFYGCLPFHSTTSPSHPMRSLDREPLQPRQGGRAAHNEARPSRMRRKVLRSPCVEGG